MMRALACLAMLSLAQPAQAYVTSAVLEYSVDDQAAFFLNGSPILKRSNFAPFDFSVLSTSDGTLPMELFNTTGENVLAVENFDTEGDHMSISYRFTVHTSDGDPIVIWSDPEQAKMLNLKKEQRNPEGWTQVGFDDSAWTPAKLGTEIKYTHFSFPQLPDESLGGLFGDPFVPRLAHNFNMKCNTGDHNLYRSRFRFPDKPGKVQAIFAPAQASKGQKVAVRLVPGPDSAEFSQFNVLAWLPAGLEPTSTAPGAKYDAKLRRLSWSYNRQDLKVGYAKMNLAKVVSASGWKSPEKALGPFKSGKGRRKLNTPDSVWNDGAGFSANRPAWFKTSPHGVDLKSWRPQILGVLIRSQMKLGGKDTATSLGADAVRLNYSVDGTQRGALEKDALVSRMSSPDYWFDGWYDASEDRKWSWEDLDRLQVKIEATARGTQDLNLLSALEVTVKYYTPSSASPWFYAQVTEPRCTTLKVSTGTFRAGNPLLASDPVDLPVNQALCPPKPAPTATHTPIPKQQMVAPTPEPKGPGLALQGENRFGLGCLEVNPSPVNFAGAFIQFCVTKDVDITLNVYSGSTGKLVRQLKGGAFRPGNNQLFYNALDDNGKPLAQGKYIFELFAEKDGFKEMRNGSFDFVKKRKR